MKRKLFYHTTNTKKIITNLFTVMKTQHLALLLALSALITVLGCTEEIDETKPEVNLLYETTFPQNCDSLTVGETFVLKVQLTDNEALASYTVHMHHNFDHHGHTTELEACNLDPAKEDGEIIQPFNYSHSLPIEGSVQEYVTNLEIKIPEDADPGDYHLQITAVDRAGWSSFVIIAVKIIAKE